jgi:hypothetical protein
VDELIKFLGMRLDEVERDALEARGSTSGGWWHQETERAGAPTPWAEQIASDDGWIADLRDLGMLAGAHIGRHNPKQVLADVRSKRRILALYEQHAAGWQESSSDEEPGRELLKLVVRMLAEAYDQHQDYKSEWRP